METIGDITLLQISDLRCIKFISIELDPESGELIKIAGPNDSGKSTVLDGLKFAFEGAANIPKGVIRNGLYSEGKLAGKEIDRANIRVETDAGYIIERVIRKDKHGQQVAELSVTKKGEGQIASAQTFLNEISTKYPDPTVIAELEGEELFKEIVKIANIDLSSIDSQIEEIKLDMKAYRKELKDLGTPTPPKGERIEEKKMGTLITELNEKRRQRQERDQAEEEISRMKVRIDSLKQELQAAEEAQDKLNVQLSTLPEVSDEEIELLEEGINNIEEHNKLAREWQQYDEKVKQRQFADQHLNELHDQANEVMKKRYEELLNANLPGGLLLENGTVTLGEDRIMWDSLSTSQRLELGTLLALYSIPEGAPKYLYVQRGESLGKERQREIAKLAKEQGAKVLMEIMSEKPEHEDNAIVVRHGEVFTKTPAASQPDEYDLF